MEARTTQRDKAHSLLRAQGMLRLTDLLKAGITAATVVRMERTGEVIRLRRGLYQLPDAPMGEHHELAETAKLVPKGIICLTSALVFHGLTDQLPREVWIAIGQTDWTPHPSGRPLRVIKFKEALLHESVETHIIESVPVKIFGVAKTIADCFRHRSKVGLSVAIEGLKGALRQRKASPAELSRQAHIGGVITVMRPYLEALTANG